MDVWVLVLVIHLKLFGLWDVTTTVPAGEYASLTECMQAAAIVAERRDQPGAAPVNTFGAVCQRQLEA